MPQLLNALFSRAIPPAEKNKALQEEFDIDMPRAFETEMSEICNLSQDVCERASWKIPNNVVKLSLTTPSMGISYLHGRMVGFCGTARYRMLEVALYGRTDVAASETIRICLERGVLVPFLNARQKEVHDIMRTLFNQEAVWEIERYNIREEGREEGGQRVSKRWYSLSKNS